MLKSTSKCPGPQGDYAALASVVQAGPAHRVGGRAYTRYVGVVGQGSAVSVVEQPRRSSMRFTGVVAARVDNFAAQAFDIVARAARGETLKIIQEN